MRLSRLLARPARWSRAAMLPVAVLGVGLLAVGCTPGTPGAGTPGGAETDPELDALGIPSYMVKGDPKAAITLFEWSDYQCPYCAKYSAETWPQIATEYVEPGKVRIVFRDFPLTMHPHAQKASEAARCVGEIGGAEGYWKMHDRLFATQDAWSAKDDAAADFKQLAGEIGVDQARFDKCLDEGEQTAAVQASIEAGGLEGLQATPTFVLKGGRIEGAYPFETFKEKLDIVLAGGELPTPPPEYVQVDAPKVEFEVGDAPVRGDADAKVTFIEVSDFQCPYCAQFFQQSNEALIGEYVDTGRVRYAFVDLPLAQIHPQAAKAAEAAHCARDQGGDEAFFKMHDALFAGQERWAGSEDAVAMFATLADEAGLDGAALKACVDAGTHTPTVDAAAAKAMAIGLNGTPSFVINNQVTAGVLDPAMLKDAIERAERGDPVQTWMPWEVAVATATAEANQK